MSPIAAEAEFRALMDNLRESAPQPERAAARELHAVMRGMPRDLDRALLRMRCLEGRTVPEIVGALEERGIYYTQRHVERLLRRAMKAALAAYLEREKEKERRHHETSHPA
ncbi:MAG: hypothetical protein ACSW8E_05400 [Clostridia bacterium]